MPPKGYADLHKLPEDERIKLIGETAMRGGVVGICCEIDEGFGPTHAKGDRYRDKLLAMFPELEIVKRVDGPVENVETLHARRKGT